MKNIISTYKILIRPHLWPFCHKKPKTRFSLKRLNQILGFHAVATSCKNSGKFHFKPIGALP